MKFYRNPVERKLTRRDNHNTPIIAFSVLIACCLLVMLFSPRPKSYVEVRTSYDFAQDPPCIYKYNAVDHGKDYNVIYVFSIDSDADGFQSYLENSTAWNRLPITSEILEYPLLDRSFDKQVNNMLNCTHGYWYWDERFHDFMVYDIENHLLYIRRASIL